MKLNLQVDPILCEEFVTWKESPELDWKLSEMSEGGNIASELNPGVGNAFLHRLFMEDILPSLSFPISDGNLKRSLFRSVLQGNVAIAPCPKPSDKTENSEDYTGL